MIRTILLLTSLVSPVDLDFRLLPPGHNTVLPGVGQVRYYSLEDYLRLADFDHELFILRQNLDDLAAANDALNIRLIISGDKIGTLQSDNAIMAARCERLRKNWDDCEEKVVGCEAPWWPWVVAAGGVAVGLVGVGLAAAASLNIF